MASCFFLLKQFEDVLVFLQVRAPCVGVCVVWYPIESCTELGHHSCSVLRCTRQHNKKNQGFPENHRAHDVSNSYHPNLVRRIGSRQACTLDLKN